MGVSDRPVAVTYSVSAVMLDGGEDEHGGFSPRCGHYFFVPAVIPGET